jgi:glycosyltransferase involved in cell wall biosynthesis
MTTAIATNPLVSVIIPSYNHDRFIGKAVRSVLDQTYQNIEIIVVDNHSTDDTREVLAGLGCPERIRILDIENDGIIAASRNLGMRHAQGEWVAFLDSDDSWMPEKLERMLTLAWDDQNLDVLCHDEYKVFENSSGKQPLRHGPVADDFYRVLLLDGNRLSTSATMVRKSFLDRHGLVFSESIEHVTVEDYALWLDLARAGGRFGFLQEYLGEYFIHASNSSAGLQSHWQNNENLLRHHLLHIQTFTGAPEKLLTKLQAKHRLSHLKQALAAGEISLAGKALLDILFRFPLATCRCLLDRCIGKVGETRQAG